MAEDITGGSPVEAVYTLHRSLDLRSLGRLLPRTGEVVVAAGHMPEICGVFSLRAKPRRTSSGFSPGAGYQQSRRSDGRPLWQRPICSNGARNNWTTPP